MAPLRYAANFDPLLSLGCARVEGVWAEGKGSKFAILQPCLLSFLVSTCARVDSFRFQGQVFDAA